MHRQIVLKFGRLVHYGLLVAEPVGWRSYQLCYDLSSAEALLVWVQHITLTAGEVCKSCIA